jgi:hypothetical protein
MYPERVSICILKVPNLPVYVFSYECLKAFYDKLRVIP